MNELSLFTGGGGGLLGSKLLNWKTIGYVEIDEYCQKLIAQRIKDGILDNAPIFTDIKAFISSGCAELYRGVTDVITAGFPCQPFSTAGNKKGEQDERNMWPETIRCIQLVRPQYALLENVPGLLTDRYIQRIYGELVEAGYDARWCVLGADDCGANHRRKRLWILGYSKYNGLSAMSKLRGNEETSYNRCQKEQETTNEFKGTNRPFDANGISGSKLRKLWEKKEHGIISNTSKQRLPPPINKESTFGKQTDNVSQLCTNFSNSSIRRCQECEPEKEQKKNFSEGNRWWSTEPELGRVADGVANRVDRLKAIGNGQVPICMATAFQILSNGIIKKHTLFDKQKES